MGRQNEKEDKPYRYLDKRTLYQDGDKVNIDLPFYRKQTSRTKDARSIQTLYWSATIKDHNPTIIFIDQTEISNKSKTKPIPPRRRLIVESCDCLRMEISCRSRIRTSRETRLSRLHLEEEIDSCKLWLLKNGSVLQKTRMILEAYCICQLQTRRVDIKPTY